MDSKEQIIKEVLEEKMKHDKTPYNFFKHVYGLNATKENLDYDLTILLKKALQKQEDKIFNIINWWSEDVLNKADTSKTFLDNVMELKQKIKTEPNKEVKR